VRIENSESIGNCKAGFICAADGGPFRLQTNNLSGWKLVAWRHDPQIGKPDGPALSPEPKSARFLRRPAASAATGCRRWMMPPKKIPTPDLAAGGTRRAQAPPGQNRTRSMKAAGWFRSLMRFGIATGIPLMIVWMR